MKSRRDWLEYRTQGVGRKRERFRVSRAEGLTRMRRCSHSMGNSYVNYQVRANSIRPVVAMARRVCCGPAYVDTAGDGWVGVFDEISDRQDQEMMHQLTEDLSAGLETSVFAFAVNDSDVLEYLRYERGELVAEFNSWPDHDRKGDESPGRRSTAVVPSSSGSTPALRSRRALGGPDGRESRGRPAPLRAGDAAAGAPRGPPAGSLAGDRGTWREGGRHVDAMERHARLARLRGSTSGWRSWGFRDLEEHLDAEGRGPFPASGRCGERARSGIRGSIGRAHSRRP